MRMYEWLVLNLFDSCQYDDAKKGFQVGQLCDDCYNEKKAASSLFSWNTFISFSSVCLPSSREFLVLLHEWAGQVQQVQQAQ